MEQETTVSLDLARGGIGMKTTTFLLSNTHMFEGTEVSFDFRVAENVIESHAFTNRFGHATSISVRRVVLEMKRRDSLSPSCNTYVLVRRKTGLA